MVKKEFLERLVSVNFELVRMNKFVDLYIAGGMAIAFNIDEARATEDTDVFNNKMSKVVIDTLDRYNINTEISKIIKDESYKFHSYYINESREFSNINLFICNNTYLFVLKCLAQISPNRSEIKKEIDLEDMKMLYKTVNFKETFKITDDFISKSITKEHGKYLIEEIKQWQKIN